MAGLFYSSCVLLLLWFSLCQSRIPVVVKQETEGHIIHVRSTPLLDPVEELLEKFGSKNQLNLTQTEELFKSIGMTGVNKTKTSHPKGAQTCFSSKYFYGMYSRHDGNINRTDLIDLCPAVLYQMTKKDCQGWRKDDTKEEEGDTEGKEKPSRAWGFGFLFVTIISLGSLIGAFVVPLMGKPFYEKILMSMVSLAVGVLGGSGIFHLIPGALGLPLDDEDNSYLWKCAMLACGLYLFFVLECAMKLYVQFKTMEKEVNPDIASPREEKDKQASSVVEPHNLGLYYNNTHAHGHGRPNFSNGGGDIHFSALDHVKPVQNGAEVVSKEQEHKQIATVAWMIIIGDGLHNFIDGLAIGASFSSSVVVGISTSLAVISEEIPHELGDFAILLSSGLSYKQAMVANFLSACCCYVGLVIGLVLGYATSAVKYIYGIAGGMFLYISLVDMLPEALEMARNLSGSSKSKTLKMMLLVNFAIVLGFSVMLVIALYGSSIEV